MIAFMTSHSGLCGGNASGVYDQVGFKKGAFALDRLGFPFVCLIHVLEEITEGQALLD
ncbi:hypothetical protein [Pelagimonas varians]|uniref:hypothetical protein n=1 Tax=Pelagimonas varians TaxID=696760 RepID=UPI0014760DF4|nr:hypothetical protein [Pelagimonas varians]